MLVRAHSFAIRGGLAEHVTVELDVRAGLPAFAVLGLSGGAARDARERVHAAVLNCGLTIPRRRVTVNLAPASRGRSGSEFDLAIACSVIAAGGLIDPERLARIGLFGELGLGGQLRPRPAAAAAAAAAADAGLERLVVARPDLAQARFAQALPVHGLRELAEVVALLTADRPPARPDPGRTARGRDAGRAAPPRGRERSAPAPGDARPRASGHAAPRPDARAPSTRTAGEERLAPAPGDAPPRAGRAAAPRPDARAPNTRKPGEERSAPAPGDAPPRAGRAGARQPAGADRWPPPTRDGAARPGSRAPERPRRPGPPGGAARRERPP